MAAKGIVVNHTDDLFVPIDNHLDEDTESATGIDAAIDALDMNEATEASTNQKVGPLYFEVLEVNKHLYLNIDVYCRLYITLFMSASYLSCAKTCQD